MISLASGIERRSIFVSRQKREAVARQIFVTTKIYSRPIPAKHTKYLKKVMQKFCLTFCIKSARIDNQSYLPTK